MISTLHICEADDGGGAMKAAHRLHVSLRELGLSSSMLVARKLTQDPDVSEVQPGSLLRRIEIRINDRWQVHELARYNDTRPKGQEIFTLGKGVLGRDLVRKLFPADVVTLHWSNRLIDYRLLFRFIPKSTPIVWRLPDMNAMTGGCHYTGGCTHFMDSCGACPQLGSSKISDLSRRIHSYKRIAYSQLDPARVRIVAISKWQLYEAKRSSLLRRFSIEHIPASVNINQFQPRNKSEARQLFGLPEDAIVVAFLADAIGNTRKGFDLLLEAVKHLKIDRNIVFVAIGNGAVVYPFRSLGRIEHPLLLSMALSASDIFVSPAREEAFGQALAEAMACGLPCVSFRVGGISDVVRHGETGILAEPADVDSLRYSIESLIGDAELRTRMGRHGREIAVEEYSHLIVGKRYSGLYEELLQSTKK